MSRFSTDYTGSGIYGLLDILNSKVYIGRSKNICHRFYEHKHNFETQSNKNPMYQVPIENFVFLILYKASAEEYSKFSKIIEEVFMFEAKNMNLGLYNVTPYSAGRGLIYDLSYIFNCRKNINTAIEDIFNVKASNICRLSDYTREQFLNAAGSGQKNNNPEA